MIANISVVNTQQNLPTVEILWNMEFSGLKNGVSIRVRPQIEEFLSSMDMKNKFGL